MSSQHLGVMLIVLLKQASISQPGPDEEFARMGKHESKTLRGTKNGEHLVSIVKASTNAEISFSTMIDFCWIFARKTFSQVNGIGRMFPKSSEEMKIALCVESTGHDRSSVLPHSSLSQNSAT